MTESLTEKTDRMKKIHNNCQKVQQSQWHSAKECILNKLVKEQIDINIKMSACKVKS